MWNIFSLKKNQTVTYKFLPWRSSVQLPSSLFSEYDTPRGQNSTAVHEGHFQVPTEAAKLLHDHRWRIVYDNQCTVWRSWRKGRHHSRPNAGEYLKRPSEQSRAVSSPPVQDESRIRMCGESQIGTAAHLISRSETQRSLTASSRMTLPVGTHFRHHRRYTASVLPCITDPGQSFFLLPELRGWYSQSASNLWGARGKHLYMSMQFLCQFRKPELSETKG